MLGDIIIKVSKLKLVFMKTFRYQSFLELGKFNFEEMIWYLSIKHNKPLFTSGLYALALSTMYPHKIPFSVRMFIFPFKI